ncbi:hypothetical protein HAX54_012568, partial [Datura stramonium]|nr:hypothetical protein [Datura stramonium]
EVNRISKKLTRRGGDGVWWCFGGIRRSVKGKEEMSPEIMEVFRWVAGGGKKKERGWGGCRLFSGEEFGRFSLEKEAAVVWWWCAGVVRERDSWGCRRREERERGGRLERGGGCLWCAGEREKGEWKVNGAVQWWLLRLVVTGETEGEKREVGRRFR